MAIDESRLTQAEKLLLKLHRNFLARAKTKGDEFKFHENERDTIMLEVWDFIGTLPQTPDRDSGTVPVTPL